MAVLRFGKDFACWCTWNHLCLGVTCGIFDCYCWVLLVIASVLVRSSSWFIGFDLYLVLEVTCVFHIYLSCLVPDFDIQQCICHCIILFLWWPCTCAKLELFSLLGPYLWWLCTCMILEISFVLESYLWWLCACVIVEISLVLVSYLWWLLLVSYLGYPLYLNLPWDFCVDELIQPFLRSFLLVLTCDIVLLVKQNFAQWIHGKVYGELFFQ